MAVKRVQFSNIVQNQLPAFVRTDFPLVSEFLKSYYLGQEFQGAPIDLIQNIDQYIKISEMTNLTYDVLLDADITAFDTTIPVQAAPNGTQGFPESWGLLKIDDEIITYTGKTDTSFTGCIRGFSGVTSLKAEADPEQLVFKESDAASHEGNLYRTSDGKKTRDGAKVENLTCLFLKEFLLKTKRQLLPGFDDRTLAEELNQDIFIKQAKDFYISKGTDRSFEILFKALYNEKVEIVRPRDFLFTPSNANYRITNDLVVEPYDGDPMDLDLATLYQDDYKDIIKAYGPVTNVEKIVGTGGSFYKMSLDAGYNRDVRVNGATYGAFTVHPKTQVIGQVSAGASVIDVDSTVGFAYTGDLSIKYSDGVAGIVSYTSKSVNQFYGTSNITGIITDRSSIGINTYAYGSSFSDPDKTIKVRIDNVLTKINYPDDTYAYSVNDTARIKSLGIEDNKFKSRDWFYNTSPIYKVKTLELLDSTDWTYKVTLNKQQYLRIGDSISITGVDGVDKPGTVLDISSDVTFSIKGQGILNITETYTLRRNVLKTLSNFFPDARVYSTNVANTYKDKEKLLIASSSIPSYNAQALNTTNRQVKFSGPFVGDEFKITSTTDHGFRTGDAVHYVPQKEIQTYIDPLTLESSTREVVSSQLFEEGLYFVKRIAGSSTTIKLAKSRTNIYNGNFISLDNEVTVTDNILKPYQFKDKDLQGQRILRELKTPNDDGDIAQTEAGYTGILINGVEVRNYKANDLLRYGKIEEIEVVDKGSNYDIIDPPVLNVSDNVGSGATGYAAITGSLKEIRVIDQGFDYEGTPLVKISGGNGEGATADVNMKLAVHAPRFNAEGVSTNVSLASSTIGFGTYHQFRNAEQVLYITKSQEGVGGITTDASYYVSTVDDYTVKLHVSAGDAIAGINTVALTSYGFGQHSLESYKKKSVVESLNIVNGGSGYENKKLSAVPTGITTYNNAITIVRHGYTDGEIVTYESTGTEIGGLSSSNQYKVIVVDNNSFKLANAGVGGTNTTDYDNGVYVDLTSIGSGTHYFNYQPVSVTLDGKIGIASIGTNTFEAVVQPVFRGECTSVHLENSGVGYGSSEILNFDRQPDITLIPGAEAQLSPIVSNGQVVEVLVLNSGKQYLSPPNIEITGDGVGAVVTPVLENGSITSIKIIEGGTGYTQQNIRMSILFPGSGVKFNARLKTWTINLVEKNWNSFTDDDGFIAKPLTEKFGLQYSHLYAPRKLREAVYAVNSAGTVLYGKSDLKKVSSVEVESTDHSPIIGWAYDGNPIYGPYGYITRSGGVIAQMKSSYKIKLQDNRPPVDSFPEGMLVEDYSYIRVSDETYLDENNGRFCITPEFPKGTYAYFATVNNIAADSSGPFNNYRRPEFPYLIGNNYKSVPNKYNFDTKSTQEVVDLNKTNYLRNIDPYNLIDGDLEYEYLPLPDRLDQTIDVKAITAGEIETIGISTGGELYKVNDKVVFDNTATGGDGAAAVVSKVLGRSVSSVSVATSTITGVELYPSNTQGDWELICTNPHKYSDHDLVTISGLSTTSSKLAGVYNIGITTTTFSLGGVSTSLTNGTDAVATTGIVTYFNIRGDFAKLRENDVLGIGTERVKVLNVDSQFSRIRVQRVIDGTVGNAHTVTSILTKDSRILDINAGFNTTYSPRNNKQYYFKPLESVALGTGSGVGIGTTLQQYSVPNYPNPGSAKTQIFIPTRSIYLQDHKLETGDKLTYSANIGAGISVQYDANSSIVALADDQFVYAAKISDDLIGISSVRVGLGTTGSFVGIASTQSGSSLMNFIGIGTGVIHSFTTNYETITAEVTRNLVTVSTGETHGLESSNNIWMDVNPSNTGVNTVKYNDYNRNLIINPRDFTAAGVNTETNAITLTDHGFVTGQKIIHTATTPSAGLTDNGVYYVVRVDKNTFKLSNNFYNSKLLKPPITGITSASAGTINPVNPSVTVYEDSTVEFDLTDSSLAYTNQGTDYSAFEFNFYTDENYTETWDKNLDSEKFEVIKTGIVGITTTAKVSLTVNNANPRTLFYRLDPIYQSDLPLVKKEFVIDKEVPLASEVLTRESAYNGKYTIAVGATNTFTYTTGETPELSSYTAIPTKLSYDTNSNKAYGTITDFEIKNPGKGYTSRPGISTINSADGKGAIISVGSTSIGRILKTKFESIGYNFPIDNTVRPNVGLGVIANVTPFTSLESIGISSGGRGYTSAPGLRLFDGKTNKQIEEVELSYELGDPQVTIRKNTYGISDTAPTILPVDNTNGVGISTIRFDSTTQNATVTLSVGFSTANSFPFAIGDEVLIENTSCGIGTTGKGYNSQDYGYKLFPLTGVDENLGGIGIVTFSLSGLLDGKVPGEYDTVNSAGRIIPKKYFPLFDIKLKANEFFEEEEIKSGDKVGYVEQWNRKVGVLKISTGDDFVEGDLIQGQSSLTEGKLTSVTTFDSTLSMGPVSRVENGWETDSGFINDNMQRVQDSFYYQNFSYALKSRISYSSWNDVVSTVNHTSGFKKFSDYQLETPMDPTDVKPMSVGLATDVTNFNAVSDLYSVGNMNCVADFDLVTENSLSIGAGTLSNEIVFSSKVLQDYYESIGNRVLSIDDFSGSFNSNPRASKYSVVSTFPLNTNQAMKYITYVRDRRYVGQRQIMIVDLVHDDSFGYINQYGQAGTVYPLGDFDFSIIGTDGRLLFYPKAFKLNDFDVVAIAYRLDDNILSTGTTALGPVDIQTSSVDVASGATETVVSIGYTYRSMKILSSITSTHDEWEMEEFNLIHDGSTVDVMEYGQLSTNLGDYVYSSGFGTYIPYIDGTTLKVDFKSHAGVACTVNTIQVAISTETTTGIATNQLRHVALEGRTTSISASGTPGIHTVGRYVTKLGDDDHYDAAYYVVQVSDTTNNRYQMSEIVIVDDYNTDLGTTDSYMVEYGNVETVTGLGTFGAQANDASGTTYTELMFTPIPSIACQVKVFMNAFKIQDDANDEIDLVNGRIETMYNLYEGTDKSIKRSFNLEHRTNEIFNKDFDGSSANIVSVDNDTITLPNHFFVSGEEVKYIHAGSGTTMAIGCDTTSGFSGVGVTDKLPGSLFIYKVNEDKVKIATSAENALKAVPETLGIATVGIGTSHRFASQNQNAKVLVALDNIIQSPIVATAITSSLSKNVFTTDDLITLTGITSFIGGDLIRIENEIMRIDGVGIGSTNQVRVRRPWLGTALAGYATGTQVTKVNGNYNIVENTLTFTEAPYGNLPFGTSTNPPDDRDWTGISTSSSFQGRVFLRTGVVDSTNETYYKNKVLDDISNQFTGDNRFFDLKSDGSDITGIATENAVILINDVFQGPGSNSNYTLNQTAGITSIRFTGTATSIASDVNTSNLPIGGVIQSVGSTEGFGYQPLVAAGGTAVVSTAGTIQSIGLGFTGSGYRTGVGQIVNVGIQTQSRRDGTNITNIGKGIIGSTGALTGVAVTNTRVFYKPKDVTNLEYDNVTGISTITTVFDHGLDLGQEVQLSGIALTCTYAAAVGIQTAIYDEAVGIMTVTTTVGHGLTTVGTQKSNVILTGMAFTCSLDNGGQNHIYPRNRDRFYDTSIEVTGVGNTLTASNAVYDPVVGIVTITTSANHGMAVGDKVNIADNSLTFTCGKDNDETNHTYPRPGDYASGKWLSVLTVPGAKRFSVKILEFTPSSNTSAHTFVEAASSGITTQTGNITVNVTSSATKDQYPHTFVGTAGTGPIKTGGDYGHHFVRSAANSVVTGGGYAHSFVSAASSETIIWNAGGTATAGVGTTQPTDATYDPETGDLVLTLPNHGATTSETLGIGTGGISFKCAMDGYATVHAYPRDSDPIHNSKTAITAVTGDTVTINVGVSTLVYYTPVPGTTLTLEEDYPHKFVSAGTSAVFTGGNYAHTFVSAATNAVNVQSGAESGNQKTPSDASYAPSTGVLTLTFGSAHGMSTSDTITIDDDSLVFTCTRDSNATEHAYPRSSDPISGITTAITKTSATAFTVNVGMSTIVNHPVSIGTYYPKTGNLLLEVGGGHGFSTSTSHNVADAAYNPDTGYIDLEVTSHGFSNGEYIQIPEESLTFTCTKDGNSTNHAYPRSNVGDRDRTGSGWLAISQVGVNTFRVYVGTTSDTGDHTFVSSSAPIKKANTTIGIGTDTLTFTCAKDNHATEHTYPRTTDPVYNKQIGVGATYSGTIEVFVGITTYAQISNNNGAVYNAATGEMVMAVSTPVSGSSNYTVVHADYNPTTGIMTCMVPNHTFSNGDRIKFADGSLTFTCTEDSHATEHTYPRSTDPKSNKWLAITGVTTSVFEVNVLDTAPSTNTGVHTFVTATTDGLTLAGESIKLGNEAFTFTCGMDQHGSEHSYPRGTDPYYDTSVSVGATTSSSVSVNVGRSPLVAYGASSSTYYQANGDLVLGIGTHNVTKGDSIKIDRESLIYTCTKDGNSTQHRYPREGDPAYAGTPVTGIVSERSFEVNIGISTVTNYYTGVTTATAQPVIIVPRATDSAAAGTQVLAVLNSKTFEVQTGISSRKHYYGRGGRVDITQDVVIDAPESYSNMPLEYASGSTGVGTEATINVVVGQGSSVIDFSIVNSGYAYGVDQELTVPTGGTTGIPTTSSFGSNLFKLTVDSLFTDEFTAWTIGTLDQLDDISGLFTGTRIAFPLEKNGTAVSIRAGKGSVINVEDVILIWVNDILQVPGVGYKFEGGSIITFTEAPKAGDTCKIIFYKGSGDEVDVKFKAVIETVKKGDTLQIYNKDDQGGFWKEDPRMVQLVKSTDKIDTAAYPGPGNTTIEDLTRPVHWCRQTEDKIINDLPVGKDRELYEPVINPSAYIIQSVGIGSTQIYVDSVRPFFDPANESSTATSLTFQDKITFIPTATLTGAAATVTVSGLGTVTAFNITEGGQGYSVAPNVSVAKTSVGVGTTSDALGTPTITNGVLTGIAVSAGGDGYTWDNPPNVLIGPPTAFEETNTVLTFNGDQGVIVGFGTTTISSNPYMMMDLFIPRDSFLRNSLYMTNADAVGSITTVTGISTGDYFIVDNSNIGLASTSIVSLDVSGNTVGTGISFIDNVYQVSTYDEVTINVTGIGFTDVRRIYTRLSDTFYGGWTGITSSPDFGNYSWGMIELQSRSGVNSYTAYNSSGVAGITTSPQVERTVSLKYKDYNT